jgi:hypothetical protein
LTAPNSAAPSAITPIPVIPEFPTQIIPIITVLVATTLMLAVGLRKKRR